MGWFRKMVGEGKISAELTMSYGAKYTVKIPYEGAFIEVEMFEQVRSKCWVDHGLMLTDMIITGAY